MLLADRGREPYERSLAELVLADLARRTGSVTDAGVRLTQFETTSADLDRSAVLDSLHGRIVAETRGIGAEQSTNRDLVEPLTPRELAVLRLLRSPLTQREIANELFVSFNTSRTHTKAIYRKLGVASRSEAVAAAQRAKLL
jgi:LuxR family maltose regulon positive regulatory protein